MTDELILSLADMADISPKKVRLIINAYEKAKADYKPVPEGYTAFEYEGKRYAYKSLGVGSWSPMCASLELMKVLRNYFISSGMMEKGHHWVGSSFSYACTSDVDSVGHHYYLSSSGSTVSSSYDDLSFARFAVLPLSKRKKCHKCHKFY